jgi:Tol biopolymer transport system component
MDANGDNAKCLTPEIKICKSPSWSPDGKKIAYCVFMRGSYGKTGTIFIPDAIFIMDSDGENKQSIGNGWYPFWFPDGQRIAFFSVSRPGVICTTSIDGSKTREYLTRLTSYYLANNYPTLSVSPDSKLVAFDSRDFTGKRDIYTLSLPDGTIKKLTGNVPANCYSPTWSPDGSKIAFTMETSNDLMGHIGTDIYVMDSDGGNPTLLIKDGMFPSWQRGE